MTQAAITTHILDLESGEPARGVLVWLQCPEGQKLQAITDADGRISEWQGHLLLTEGVYEMRFKVGAYFSARGVETFFDEIPVQFHTTTARAHYHVPLLLSPFGYSTYRGS